VCSVCRQEGSHLDDRRFDSLTKLLASGGNRRRALKGLIGLSAVAVSGATRMDANAARRPARTPQPVTCPAHQQWDGNACVCPTENTKCGPDCCPDDSATCCDNACCFGVCYGEERCCDADNWCEATDECCGPDEVCCDLFGYIAADQRCCLDWHEPCSSDSDCCSENCLGSGICGDHCFCIDRYNAGEQAELGPLCGAGLSWQCGGTGFAGCLSSTDCNSGSSHTTCIVVEDCSASGGVCAFALSECEV
jgi:hypothetical protein